METAPPEWTTTPDYNAAQRLSTASLGRTRVSNVYNAAGQRVRKTVDTREILFHYAPGGQLLAETEATGSPLREYIYLDQMPLSLTVHTRKPGRAPSGKGPPPGQGPPPHAPLPDQATTLEVHTYYVHTDHLGTPQRLTDLNQQIVWDAVYAPFGEVALRTEQVMQPLRFPGQYADMETGLHQNWHRDYDPALGRYLQSDPIGLSGGINTYAYALDNPVSYADPLGLDVYVGQHGALFPSNPLNHTAIVLRPNNPLVFANHPLFVATRGMQATLGGQPGGSGAIGFFGSLNSAPNYLGDDPEGLTELISVACPNGLDDTAFINSLIDAANRYGNNLRYDPFPDPFGLTYNSNSYVSGVIRAAGGIPPALPGSQPGYDRPIPIGP